LHEAARQPTPDQPKVKPRSRRTEGFAHSAPTIQLWVIAVCTGACPSSATAACGISDGFAFLSGSGPQAVNLKFGHYKRKIKNEKI
jgi:hypothetical protein